MQISYKIDHVNHWVHNLTKYNFHATTSKHRPFQQGYFTAYKNRFKCSRQAALVSRLTNRCIPSFNSFAKLLPLETHLSFQTLYLLGLMGQLNQSFFHALSRLGGQLL